MPNKTPIKLKVLKDVPQLFECYQGDIYVRTTAIMSPQWIIFVNSRVDNKDSDLPASYIEYPQDVVNNPDCFQEIFEDA